jgi:hypothetical protein
VARKRIIDPEFWSDEEIGHWSYAARLFYIGLWNFADDEGRFKAPDALLKAQIFPYEPKIDIGKLKKELNHKIQWYEVEGLQYGFIRNFNKHQRIDRPTESKLPKPPPFVEPSPNTQRGVLPNISKVNIREEKGRTPQLSDEEFIKTLKTKAVYKGIDLDRELGLMDAWLMVHPGRKKTRKFIVAWLNRIDRPLETQKQPKQPTLNPKCSACGGSGKLPDGARCWCVNT